MSEDGKLSHTMDQKNQYCENGCTTKSNLHVQCNPHQNSMTIFTEIEKKNPKIHMKVQKTSNSQSNSEQIEKC
jgi:hypothetical protein